MQMNRRTESPTAKACLHELEGERLLLRGRLTLKDVEEIDRPLIRELGAFTGTALSIDLGSLVQIDSAGVTLLNHLRRLLAERGVEVSVVNIPPSIEKTMEIFSIPAPRTAEGVRSVPLWEWTGDRVYYFFNSLLRDFLNLTVDVFFWTFVDIFRPRAHRRGEFVNQAVIIGVNAVPLVGLVSFLIGLVIALQSAVQLRQFGANIFITDLIVIAMTREMGPLITAIMIAGRSGSAIASEIATMKVTEEVDALKTMALNPVRYIVIPKMHASIFTMPFLTILADILGIVGGMVIAFAYLDLTPQIFLNRMVEVLFMKDIVTGLIKSLVFAGLIVLTGSFFGFRVTGGAEGVGRYTTASVVTSIFMVILADSAMGLLFY